MENWQLSRGSIVGAAIAALVLLVVVPAEATVPGENGQIAFVSDRDGNNEIYVMNPDGSAQVRLTNHPAADSEPDWSPDGRMIAFTSDRGGAPAVYVMNADGTGVHLVGEGSSPAWSPDGTRFVFKSGDSLWTMSTDGSNRQRLTNAAADTGRVDFAGNPLTPEADYNAQWSPDGTVIMFVRAYLGFDRITFTVVPGEAPVVLTEHINATTDDWSPDAGRLVGASFPVGQSGIFRGGTLFVIDLAGTSVFQVPKPTVFTNMYEPVWSPDGAQLAYGMTPTRDTTSPDWREPEIAVSPADGSPGVVNLTNHPAEDFQPDWQSLNPYPVGLMDPSTGRWHLRSESAAVTSFYYGNPGDFPLMGDWDGDGIDTPGLYRQSDGFAYLRNSNTEGIADMQFFFGNPGDIPLAGDFDGDGFDTVSIYRPAEGRVFVVNHLGSGDAGLGAADLAYYFGNPGDKPFVGDFDGDGVDTIGLHRESTGLVYFRNSHTSGPAESSFVFGDPGDRVVSHDWNGDGADSVGLFRPANSKVYIRFFNAAGSADREYFFGNGGWLPVTGEFGLP